MNHIVVKVTKFNGCFLKLNRFLSNPTIVRWFDGDSTDGAVNTTGRLCHLVERDTEHFPQGNPSSFKDYDGNNPADNHYSYTQVNTGHLLLHFQSDKNRAFFGFRIR